MNQQRIEQLEAELRQAQLNADVDALDRLIDDALLFAGPDGALASKADDLAAHRSGVVRFNSHEPLAMAWRAVSDDVALVSLLARLTVQIHGSSVTGDFRYTRVWQRDAEHPERWRIVGGQVSAVSRPS